MTMATKQIHAAVLLLLTLAAIDTTSSRFAQGFIARLPTSPSSSLIGRGGASSSLPLSDTAAATGTGTTETVPSWESLESELGEIRSSIIHGEEKKPVLTLYRDTNGWCPFCERVWVAVRAKGLPYQETLVPLQGKPEWYKQMVPTGLVPAVLFHGDDNNNTTSSRELVWESDAIMHALDEKFPDTPKLMLEGNAEFDAALEMQNRLQAAGFKFAYGNRNGTLTDDELQQNRDGFESVLDELNVALGEQAAAAATATASSSGDDNKDVGCFRLGADFSGIDAIMIPTLERWRFQLPLTENIDILENRVHLRNWFDHLDSFEAYSDRVAGDEYSWTATASTFLRYFGGGEDKPHVAEGIARADAAAEKLTNKFASSLASNKNNDNEKAFALEAATKLITNHEAVVADCVREEPLSQKHIPRASASKEDTADALLRHVSSLLLQIASSSLSSSDTISSAAAHDAKAVVHGDGDGDVAAQGALAMKAVAKRLCVPRDMGAPSAALLRGILNTVADNLLYDNDGAVETTEVDKKEEAVIS